MELKVKRLSDAIEMPRYQTAWAAGLDLMAAEAVTIPWGGNHAKVRTGIAIEIPHGYVGLLAPRSGLADKHGLTIVNTPGIIDSDYRGEMRVQLINHSKLDFDVGVGMRIAQLLIVPIARVRIVEVQELSTTARGDKGFGSTGT